jgi:hypothetical protein
MGDDLTVAEPDVLIAATVFLIERGVTPYQFSVAAGRGLDTFSATERLREAFRSIGHSPRFTGDGPDILGISDSEWWIVECKGAGAGKSQTQRNNFDRALASVVSYFEETPQGVAPEFQSRIVCLGLALPATRSYLNELRSRVRSPVRRRLNLWVLLYQPESHSIRPMSPDEAI